MYTCISTLDLSKICQSQQETREETFRHEHGDLALRGRAWSIINTHSCQGRHAAFINVWLHFIDIHIPYLCIMVNNIGDTYWLIVNSAQNPTMTVSFHKSKFTQREPPKGQGRIVQPRAKPGRWVGGWVGGCRALIWCLRPLRQAQIDQ